MLNKVLINCKTNLPFFKLNINKTEINLHLFNYLYIVINKKYIKLSKL